MTSWRDRAGVIALVVVGVVAVANIVGWVVFLQLNDALGWPIGR